MLVKKAEAVCGSVSHGGVACFEQSQVAPGVDEKCSGGICGSSSCSNGRMSDCCGSLEIGALLLTVYDCDGYSAHGFDSESTLIGDQAVRINVNLDLEGHNGSHKTDLEFVPPVESEHVPDSVVERVVRARLGDCLGSSPVGDGDELVGVDRRR